MLKQAILAAAVAGLVLAVAPVAQAMEFVSIGDPKNPDDETLRGPYGGVPYEYRIGKYEVMIAEWEKSGLGDGDEDEWKESVGPGAPAVNVTLHEAAQFANWMTKKYGGGNPYYKVDESGKMSIPTEDGNPISHYDWAVTKGKGTTYFIPTEDEWYKAAYYKGGGTNAGYYEYPTQSDIEPSNDLIDPDPGNNATFYDGDYTIWSPHYRTEVGAHENSESPYGTFDQGGNVWEWNETSILTDSRGLRGGSGPAYADNLAASFRTYGLPTGEGGDMGFRLASLSVPDVIPEPATLSLLGIATTAMLRRRKRRA
jgi:hypothetical protein